NWAEMMDFWHCHKPHEKDGAKTGKYANYGSGFEVDSGTGLVDRVGFLFTRHECEDAVQVCAIPSSKQLNSCSALPSVVFRPNIFIRFLSSTLFGQKEGGQHHCS